MPGMMDTILNLGLNDQTVIGLADASKNPRFAWDSYRRFVQLFGKVVFGIDDKQFDEVLQKAKRQQNVLQDHELSEQPLVEAKSGATDDSHLDALLSQPAAHLGNA